MKEHSGSEANVIEIKTAIDEQKSRNRFAVMLVLVGAIVMALDGYDMLSLSFVVPALAKVWKINPGQFGPIMALGNVGLIFGAFLFGYLGDKLGRRKAIVISMLTFSIFSFACAWSTNFTMLFVARVLCAIGIGGVTPAVVVLNSDYAPRKSKLKRVTLLFVGLNIGSGGAGIVAKYLLPHFGWQSIFLVGGAAPLLMLIIVALWLPESLCWLAMNQKTGDKKNARMAALLKRLRPDLSVTPEAQFVYSSEKKEEKAKMKDLFAGRLGYITPLLFLNFIISMFFGYFLTSWMATLLTLKGLSPANAAGMTAFNIFGGAFGSLTVGSILDKAGFKWAAIAPAAVFTFALCFGLSPIFGGTLALILVMGYCHACYWAITPALIPLFYPVNIRSSASGAGLAISRIGGIIAPLVGGALIAAHVPVERIYFLMSLPLLGGIVILAVVTRLYLKYYSGSTASVTQPAPATEAIKSAR